MAYATLETFLKAYIAQLKFPKQWSRLLSLAECTYNVTKYKPIGMSPFKADIAYIPGLRLDLLALDPRTPTSKPGTEYAEQLVKIVRMLPERMEETQLAIVSEANEHRQPHPFRVGDTVFLGIRLLPVAYANVNSAANDSANSGKFQNPYAGPFTLLKKVGENAFVLDIPAHWRLRLVFNVSRFQGQPYPRIPATTTTPLFRYRCHRIRG
jgi:hypothetical protein